MMNANLNTSTPDAELAEQELQPTSRLQRWRMVLGSPADAS